MPILTSIRKHNTTSAESEYTTVVADACKVYSLCRLHMKPSSDYIIKTFVDDYVVTVL